MDQVQRAVGQLDVHAQLRIVRHEPRHQRHDKTFAIGHGAGHAQHALGFAGQVAHRAQGLLATVLQALAVLQEGLAGFGQRHLACAAVQQSGLQAFFQARHLPADVGGRYPQSLGRRRELAAFGHRDKLVNAFPAVLQHGDCPCTAIMFCFGPDYSSMGDDLHSPSQFLTRWRNPDDQVPCRRSLRSQEAP